MNHEHVKMKQEQLSHAEMSLQELSERLRRQNRLEGRARHALADELMIVQTFRELLFDSTDSKLLVDAGRAIERARTLVSRIADATAC